MLRKHFKCLSNTSKLCELYIMLRCLSIFYILPALIYFMCRTIIKVAAAYSTHQLPKTNYTTGRRCAYIIVKNLKFLPSFNEVCNAFLKNKSCCKSCWQQKRHCQVENRNGAGGNERTLNYICLNLKQHKLIFLLTEINLLSNILQLYNFYQTPSSKMFF